ncbi:MAG TPA: amidase [Dehalococcoidia bacterium]|nr:amidase [Dehalococcoidia bacterium]
MSDTELAFTPAWRMAELIRTKRLSPVELVDHLLDRIQALNPKLNAYLAVMESEARKAAQAAETAVMEGAELPPLHGVPVSIKDLYFVKGVPNTFGSLVYKEFVPDADSVVVERLRQAGAIILGKTNTSEFGLSATTENRLGDDCRNPWNLKCTAGGSSGGAAAAVAAGLGPLAIGSDYGGSIRIPASFCGIFGLKPSHGRVPSHDCRRGMELFGDIGPIARTVRDGALLLSIIAGFDPRDPFTTRQSPPNLLEALDREVKGLRLAWSPDLGYARVNPEVRSIAERAALSFQSLGCLVEEVRPALGEFFPAYDLITLADQYAFNGHLLAGEADKLMPYVKSILEHGQRVTLAQYSQALRQIEHFRRRLADVFESYDLLLSPTTAVPAFPIGQRPRIIDGQEVSPVWGAFPLTAPFNISGWPAASVPCGFSTQGLPIGLQIAGRWGEEATVLQVAAAWERIQPWSEKLPSL